MDLWVWARAAVIDLAVSSQVANIQLSVKEHPLQTERHIIGEQMGELSY